MEQWSILKDLPAVALLGGLCYMMLRTFLTQVDAVTSGTSRRFAKIEKSIDANTIAILSLHDTLLRHDLTTSGIEELTADNKSEAAAKALAKYDSAHKSILEVKRLVLANAGIEDAE